MMQKKNLAKTFNEPDTVQKRIYSFKKEQIHFLCSKAYFAKI